jgi:hypothetical protein
MIAEPVVLFLIIYAGGHAARAISDFILSHESLTDPLCGYERDTSGTARVVDKEKERSIWCKWALCSYCQSGWLSLYTMGLLWYLSGQDFNLAVMFICWLATWRVATSLPE